MPENDYTPVTLRDLAAKVTDALTTLLTVAIEGEDTYNARMREEHEALSAERQAEINRDHFAEDEPFEELEYVLSGEATPGPETGGMSRFNSFGKSDLSIKETTRKLFKDYGFLKRCTISLKGETDPGRRFDAHRRDDGTIALFSADGVYKDTFPLDAEVEDHAACCGGYGY